MSLIQLFILGVFLSVAGGQQQDQKNSEHKIESDASPPSKPETKPSRKKQRKKKKWRRCRQGAPPKYRRMIRRWRKVPRIPKPKYREGLRDLVFYSVNHGERLRIFPYLPDGTLDDEALTKLQRIFRDKDTGAEHPVHPRLVKLLYKLADRFDARQITVISGYREAVESGDEGQHSLGRAADIVIPGVSLGMLARQARRLGRVGVGLYPNSGFIHVDVRDGPSFFWVDRSGPGQRQCLRRILPLYAQKRDRKWRPKQDEPKRHVNRKGEFLGAIPPPEEPTEDETAVRENKEKIKPSELKGENATDPAREKVGL